MCTTLATSNGCVVAVAGSLPESSHRPKLRMPVRSETHRKRLPSASHAIDRELSIQLSGHSARTTTRYPSLAGSAATTSSVNAVPPRA